jgi:biotin--protein ligase
MFYLLLYHFQDTSLRIKWPNDIYFGRTHKLGGVLVQCSLQRDQLICVFGCGVNVCNEKPTVRVIYICINVLLF